MMNKQRRFYEATDTTVRLPLMLTSQVMRRVEILRRAFVGRFGGGLAPLSTVSQQMMMREILARGLEVLEAEERAAGRLAKAEAAYSPPASPSSGGSGGDASASSSASSSAPTAPTAPALALVPEPRVASVAAPSAKKTSSQAPAPQPLKASAATSASPPAGASSAPASVGSAPGDSAALAEKQPVLPSLKAMRAYHQLVAMASPADPEWKKERADIVEKKKNDCLILICQNTPVRLVFWRVKEWFAKSSPKWTGEDTTWAFLVMVVEVVFHLWAEAAEMKKTGREEEGAELMARLEEIAKMEITVDDMDNGIVFYPASWC